MIRKVLFSVIGFAIGIFSIVVTIIRVMSMVESEFSTSSIAIREAMAACSSLILGLVFIFISFKLLKDVIKSKES